MIRAVNLSGGESAPPLERRLIVGILRLAVEDWRKAATLGSQQATRILQHEKSVLVTTQLCLAARELGYISPRQELLAFWHSDWCEYLFDHLPSVDREQAIKALGIPQGDTPCNP